MLVLAAGLGALLFNVFRSPVVTVATVRKGPAVATVYATGYVEAKERRSLKPPRAAIIEKICVHEGAEVRAGDVLIVLRDSPLESRRVAATAKAKGLQDKLGADSSYRRSWEARIAELTQTAQQARERAERLKKQLGSGGVSRDDFDEAEARAVAAHERLTTMQRDAEQTLTDLSNSLTAALAELETVAAQDRDNKILAPIDGVVLRVNAEEGEFASVDRELIKVGDLRHLIIECEVNEDDIASVSIGAGVLVRLAGDNSNMVGGSVYEILPDAVRATKSYVVRVDFKDAVFEAAKSGSLGGRTRLKDGNEPLSGMTAELGIVSREVPSTLVFPRSALTINGTVFVVDGGAVREIKVETGVQNFSVVEAKAGLKEGDRVATSGVANLKDGQRVSPQE